VAPDLILPLRDERRGRELETHVHLPPDARRAPLIVFGHGWMGHPRKFGKLFAALTGAGYAVAAPAFPRTNDRSGDPEFLDVVGQPDDLRHVARALALDGLGGRVDATRAVAAGFSLGGITAAGAVYGAEPEPLFAGAVCVGGGVLEGGPAYAYRPVPLLVVHGTEDGTVPLALAERLYREAPAPKALVLLRDGRHEEEIEDEHGPAPRVVESVLAFLDHVLRGASPAPLLALARETDGL